jgi:SAM-dependent methyltransferase
MGQLRRVTPIARDFGYGRGGPVDRYYIEAFLDRHRADVRGRTLEIGDNAYTLRYGDDRVTNSEVLHANDSNPDATYVGDLVDGSLLPPNAFDCIILTQTLHIIYDFGAALQSIDRALKPGGVVLLTVPGITNVDPGEWSPTWSYSFTPYALRQMFAEFLTDVEVDINSYGNVLTATAFLHGLSSADLNDEELQYHEIEYSIVHTARILKVSSTSQ